jgi:hypothetical protein
MRKKIPSKKVLISWEKVLYCKAKAISTADWL